MMMIHKGIVDKLPYKIVMKTFETFTSHIFRDKEFTISDYFNRIFLRQKCFRDVPRISRKKKKIYIIIAFSSKNKQKSKKEL